MKTMPSVIALFIEIPFPNAHNGWPRAQTQCPGLPERKCLSSEKGLTAAHITVTVVLR